MSMTDPLADMLTRVVNAQAVGKSEVIVPSSKLKLAVCRVLQAEGYIADYQLKDEDCKPQIVIGLKYYNGAPVIDMMRRVSTPGRRIYRGKEDLPRVTGGLGIAVISTSQGVMSDREARASGQGGEVLCIVS
jgi:small subunit ribosomal protein S8